MQSMRRLLRADCVAGLTVGSVGLALTGFGVLGEVLGLSQTVLFVVGGANVLYGLFAGSILLLPGPQTGRIALLIAANFVWCAACLLMVALHAHSASMLGWVYLLGEAVFVGGLAALEWRALRPVLQQSA
ncbi:MAG: hypothetical protein ACOVQT_10755 [Rubrivivax sp.]|jgi:hypothetical protein